MLVCNYKDCVCAIYFDLRIMLCSILYPTIYSKAWVCSLLTESAALIDPKVSTIEMFLLLLWLCIFV